MTTRTLSLQLEEDFTTHTAALFVSHANVFQSTIRIIAGERSINAKSLLGVVSLGFRQGQQVQPGFPLRRQRIQQVQVAADGPDEAEAVNALSQFFQSSASA